MPMLDMACALAGTLNDKSKSSTDNDSEISGSGVAIVSFGVLVASFNWKSN